MESHILIHTDQKPYQCAQCEQSFRQKQLLKRHVNLYHNPNYVPPSPKEKTHQCPTCSRAFRHKGNLIRHMAVHDPDSAAKAEQIALKAGRQKRIQLVDGTILSENEDDEEDEEENEMMAVEGEDGEQYVVLEVYNVDDQNQDEEEGQGIEEEEEIDMPADHDDSDEDYLMTTNSEFILFTIY